MTTQVTNPSGTENQSPAPAAAPADAGTAVAQAAADAAVAAAAATSAAGGVVTPPAYAEFAVAQGKTADNAAAEYAKAVAGELKLDQAGAQRLYDERAKQTEATNAQVKSTIDSWKAAVAADPVIGGANAETTSVDVSAAIAKFGSPGFAGLLDVTGLRHHPDIVRTLATIGKLLKQDTTVVGVPAKGSPADRASKMFDGK